MRPKHILLISCFVLIVSSTISSTKAKTETFSVPPETDLTKPLVLKENDRVFIGFSVIGKTSNQIDFFITNPDEDVVNSYDNAGHVSFSFLTTEAGTYTLHFHNTQPTEAKTVTLNYDVEHYILGVPQEMFLTMIIVIICVLAVAAFILVGKPN
ncbi:MAG: emp24/gp25L/p24 family protein [Candidatus Bathyarchaeota archaeon]|nr:MAG: emp24/gp25L/p24 family protein [Candidatus Bathyarchaeota archaeon]